MLRDVRRTQRNWAETIAAVVALAIVVAIAAFGVLLLLVAVGVELSEPLLAFTMFHPAAPVVWFGGAATLAATVLSVRRAA